jgi:hypothetical protein
LLAAALVTGSVAVALPLAAAGGKGTPNSAKVEFEDAVNQGCVKYTSRDNDGAIDMFRKATTIQPRNPMGYYLLGEAQLGAGSLSDAEASWVQAEQVADAGPPALKAKILFVMADLRERQGRWDDAKAAWKVYGDYAAQTGDAGAFPETATTRIHDIEAMQKLYVDTAVVRKRIREEDGGALGKMPPPERQ